MIAVGLVVAAVIATQTAVGDAVPGLGLFAASFVALVGATVFLAIARKRRVSLPVPAPTLLVIAAVAASIALLVALMLEHPAAAVGLLPARAVIVAAALAGCLGWPWPHRAGWAAVAWHRTWASSRLSSFLGGCAASYVEGLLSLWMFFGPWVAFGIPAGIAAAKGRSFRAGLEAGVWTAIAVMSLNLATSLAGMLREYAVNGRFTFTGDLTTAGFSFGFTFMVFMAIPIIGFPFAVLGAVIGKTLRS